MNTNTRPSSGLPQSRESNHRTATATGSPARLPTGHPEKGRCANLGCRTSAGYRSAGGGFVDLGGAVELITSFACSRK